MSVEPYRQSIRDLDLAIELGTTRVPGDGRFYVLLRGKVLGSHRTLKQAQAQYKEILTRQHWKPEPMETTRVDPSSEAVERYMDALEEYWSTSHGYRRRGGKTMYRS